MSELFPGFINNNQSRLRSSTAVEDSGDVGKLAVYAEAGIERVADYYGIFWDCYLQDVQQRLACRPSCII